MLDLPMELLQTCVLFTTLVVCGADDIRPAGWLDKVVAHWKKSFIGDFEQLGPFNLDASIEPTPPGYQDSPDWDFDSVSRMLALLSVSETGQPTLNSLRRMIAPTRRMMMNVPGLAVNYIPHSVNKNRMYHRSGTNDRRRTRYFRKRTGNNRMGINDRRRTRYFRKRTGNNRMGNNNRMGIANKRKRMAFDRMRMQSKIARKQMIEKRLKEERPLSDLQMSFKLFPSIKDEVPNEIYYDEEPYDYENAPPEYEYVIASSEKTESADDAIVLLKNPVEARLPSSRISVRLLKEILEARAEAARVMPTKKTTGFTWEPMDMTTPLTNETSDGNSTSADGAATGAAEDGAATDAGGDGDDADGGGGEATTGADGAAGGDAPAEGEAPAEDAPPAEEAPPEGRKRAAKAPRKHA